MRTMFPGYYKPSEREFEQLWNSCIFVLDANVLLNQYRYSEDTSNQFIKIFEQISSRLWIPYQAAFEYQNQRLNVINKQLNQYKDLKEFIDNIEKNFDEKLRPLKRHPYIDPDTIMKKVKRTFTNIKKSLNKIILKKNIQIILKKIT